MDIVNLSIPIHWSNLYLYVVSQGTLLHMVASHQNSFLLSSVVTLYKRRGCLGKALMSRNVFQETPLLCTLAIYDTDLTNFMYLYELCEEHAPGAIQMTTEIGMYSEQHIVV